MRRSELILILILGACGGEREEGEEVPVLPPAETRGELTVSVEGAARIGLTTAKVETRSVARRRLFPGVIESPPGGEAVVAAPVPGQVLARTPKPLAPGDVVARGDVLVRLAPLIAPDRDLRTRLSSEAAVARARLEGARKQAERARALAQSGAGSARAAEEAEAQARIGEAEAKAAEERLAQLGRSPLSADVALPLRAPLAGVVHRIWASPGTDVAAGAALVELVDGNQLWVSVPIYVGEAPALAASATAEIRAPGAITGRQAARAPSPRRAATDGWSVELRFLVPNPDGAFVPGQRVEVVLAEGGTREARVVPSGAIVRGASGDAWVYLQTSPTTYRRALVEVLWDDAGQAVLGRGPASGVAVVVHGAPALYELEYGAIE